jgi:hypothetical protein
VLQLPAELVESLERLGASCTGDVTGLVASARAQAPGPFADSALLAQGLENAAVRRAAAGDRAGAWWLACAVATLRASPLWSPQEEAEVTAARIFGELAQSPAARAPIAEGARWIVAGMAEPPPTSTTVELARRNALVHIEQLDSDLAAKSASLRARVEAAQGDPLTRQAVDNAITSYDLAGTATRAAFGRVVDHVVAQSGDPSLAQAGIAALSELDERALPTLSSRTLAARQLLSAYGEPPVVATMLDQGDRPSFAGAAPPSFRQGGTTGSGIGSHAPSQPQAQPQPEQPPVQIIGVPPSRETLETTMRTAFEQAWTSPGAETRAAFIQAVRARYELETASIVDPDARQRALDHYVAHALAQLPPATETQ